MAHARSSAESLKRVHFEVFGEVQGRFYALCYVLLIVGVFFRKVCCFSLKPCFSIRNPKQKQIISLDG